MWRFIVNRETVETERPLPDSAPKERRAALIEAGVAPAYFAEIARRLREIAPAAASPAPAAAAAPVGGGTDLFVQRAESLAEMPLRFLLRDPALRGVRRENATWIVGGATTAEELARARDLAESIPGWTEAFPLISSWPVRERATVAGNLVNASPIGDLTILLLALDAEVVLRGPAGERALPLRAFYRGYKQLHRAPDELVAAIRFRQPPPGSRFHFEKVSRREHLDIAAVNSAALFEMEGRKNSAEFSFRRRRGPDSAAAGRRGGGAGGTRGGRRGAAGRADSGRGRNRADRRRPRLGRLQARAPPRPARHALRGGLRNRNRNGLTRRTNASENTQ